VSARLSGLGCKRYHSHATVYVARDTSKLEVTTETGKIYTVWQEVKMGFASGNSKLQKRTEAAVKLRVQA
jgi:hypothetical protein